MFISDPK